MQLINIPRDNGDRSANCWLLVEHPAGMMPPLAMVYLGAIPKNWMPSLSSLTEDGRMIRAMIQDALPFDGKVSLISDVRSDP